MVIRFFLFVLICENAVDIFIRTALTLYIALRKGGGLKKKGNYMR